MEYLHSLHQTADWNVVADVLALLISGALFAMTSRHASSLRIEFPVKFRYRQSLPGASPETMASAVATPLERQFGRIAGHLNQMTSVSQLGSTGIVLQFDLNRNIRCGCPRRSGQPLTQPAASYRRTFQAIPSIAK